MIDLSWSNYPERLFFFCRKEFKEKLLYTKLKAGTCVILLTVIVRYVVQFYELATKQQQKQRTVE